MYMNLPNSIQNKICGRCGLVGHIKKQCREDVYCKFCRNPSLSIKACRTYANFMQMDPITLSRKNTPEKRTTEDIDREITRRVQQEMKRILNNLETHRQVNEGWKMNQGFASKQQIKQNRSTHQQIPVNTNGIHNLIGDYQLPPEVPENTGNVQNGKNMGQQPVEMYPILNQQWEDPPHMQAPMAPMNINMQSNAGQKARNTYPDVPTNSTMATNRLVETNYMNATAVQQDSMENRSRNQRSGTMSMNTTSRGVRKSVLDGQTTEMGEQMRNVNMDHRRNIHMQQKDTDTRQSQLFQDSRQSDKRPENPSEDEVSVRRVFPDDGIFTKLVKDSISAQVRDGIRPMFVNNYYVGDNSWRPGVPEENTKAARQIETSTNRSSTAVQTAISSLGEDCKPESYMQTGISRVKAMGSNDGKYNTRSPLVVGAGKNSNSTGWSINSYSLPDLQFNTPTQQQSKGLPDFTVPPPAVQPPPVVQLPSVVQPLPVEQSQQNGPQTGSQRLEENLMRMIESMEQQMRLNSTKSEYNMTQNTKMMDQFIKAQDRRDLDPALMDIPTFSGDKPEKCLEWVTRIKNVCRQSGCLFQQELTNKSGLVVQNFLATLDRDIADSELVEKILQMFSDIPTTAQAIAKLKTLRQGENESILAYNQRYRILVERVEGRTIEQITSPVAMEMYLGTIIPPLRKSIKNSLFWNSKHAPRTVGEAMSKAQQLYVKHLYTTGDEQEDDHSKTGEEVVINEISRKFENRYRDRHSDFCDSSQN